MKLREVKWHNHPILGDLKIDLVDPDTHIPYDTIVIAGENGTGKTTILETLYDFLNQGPITPFEYVEYQLDNGDIYRAYPLEGSAIDSYFKVINIRTEEKQEIRSNRNNRPDNIRTTLEDPRHYGCAYTKARAIYETKPITSTSGMHVDGDIYKNEGDTNANQLKQLLVDIYTKDVMDWYEVSKSNPNLSRGDFEKNDSKMHRFSTAFNSFFDNIKYNRVTVVEGKHEVFFQKYGKDIKIDNLSTGESQIVFRGADLLRNAGKLDGSVIFIDEPEISMHPLWQEKILSYYKGIFTKGGVQKAQLIVATHSQGVIKEALKDNKAGVIILRCDVNGKVEPCNVLIPRALSYPSSAEFSYQAFNVASTDYHNELYGYIDAEGWIDDYKQQQGESEDYIQMRKDGTAKPSVKKCLSEKLRHMIHHPENTYNGEYKDEELKKSIDDMRNYILNHP